MRNQYEVKNTLHGVKRIGNNRMELTNFSTKESVIIVMPDVEKREKLIDVIFNKD